MNDIPDGIDISLARHAGLLEDGAQDKLRELGITVIGAGAIGSWLMPALAKIGCENVKFIDFDTVEEVNIANQLYGHFLINKKKIEALKLIDDAQYLTKFEYIDDEVTEENADSYMNEIMIAAVDSIAVRKIIWEACQEREDTKLYLDCRIGRYNAQGYSVRPHEDLEVDYFDEHYMFPATEAAEIPCTEKTIIFPCMWCAAFLTSEVVSYANNRIANGIFRMEYEWKTHRTIRNTRQQIMELQMGA